MYSIENSYTNDKETLNIRNIHFLGKEDVPGSFGSFITQSEYREDVIAGKSEGDGIYLFYSNEPGKAFRIYKDFADYKYSKHYDDQMISKLQKAQPNVKLTNFPTGIVTIDKYVVGQEIVLYEGLPTLKKLLVNNLLDELPTHYYLEILKILKELYNNGIIYQDVHPGNFLVDGDKLKLIDFDDMFVSFDKDGINNMLNNLRMFIVVTNNKNKIRFDKNIARCDNLDEIEDMLKEEHYRLVRKG